MPIAKAITNHSDKVQQQSRIFTCYIYSLQVSLLNNFFILSFSKFQITGSRLHVLRGQFASQTQFNKQNLAWSTYQVQTT